MVKQFFVILVVLFFCEVAFANPIVFDPLGSVASVLLLGGAVTVEACLVTLMLLFFNMPLKPLFFAVFLGNLAVYFALFLPLLDSSIDLWLLEALIVIVDGIMIKVISCFGVFQEADFKGLKWKWAFLAAILGNSVSYLIGAALL